MDYGFAPGITDFDKQFLNLLGNRKTAAFDTTAWPDVSTVPPASTVGDFWSHLLLTHVPKPIGDVIIATHGNDMGSMVIKIVHSAAVDSDYDELRRIQIDPTDPFDAQLPEILRKTPPNGPLQPIKIHIRGCRIGSDVKFMNRLQDVFGNMVAVTAPKHLAGVFAIFDGKRHVIDPPSHGYAECLVYDFEIKSKTKITDRAKLLKAFRDAKLPFIDSIKVPDALWDAWVPKRKFNDAKVPIALPNLSLGAIIASTNPGVVIPRVKEVGVPGVFEHSPYTQPFKIGLAAKPKPSDYRTILLNALGTLDAYSRADHPFHESLGFATLADYVDAFTWAPTWSEKDKVLTLMGTYHYYNVQIPLCDPTIGVKTDPKTWQLLYNFYPLRALPLAAIERLFVTDPRLFFTATP